MPKTKKKSINFYEDEITDLQIEGENFANSVRIHLGLEPIKRGRPMEDNVTQAAIWQREYRRRKKRKN